MLKKSMISLRNSRNAGGRRFSGAQLYTPQGGSYASRRSCLGYYRYLRNPASVSCCLEADL